MNIEEQKEFIPLIENRIAELEAELEQNEEGSRPVSPDKAIGRLSRLDSMQMQQMSLNARNRQKDELQRLKQARQRIERGTFGTCQFCRKDINKERLKHILDAEVCVQCAGG